MAFSLDSLLTDVVVVKVVKPSVLTLPPAASTFEPDVVPGRKKTVPNRK